MVVDWTLVTAVATVLGVIGGLISVAFVVYEIRRNAQAIEGATVQSLMSLEQQVFSVILNNAAIYTKGCAGLAGLSEQERQEFDQCVRILMSMTYSAFVQHQQNLIDSEVWDAYANAARVRFRQPGFLETWVTVQIGYPESFRVAMQGIIPKAPGGPGAVPAA